MEVEITLLTTAEQISKIVTAQRFNQFWQESTLLCVDLYTLFLLLLSNWNFIRSHEISQNFHRIFYKSSRKISWKFHSLWSISSPLSSFFLALKYNSSYSSVFKNSISFFWPFLAAASISGMRGLLLRSIFSMDLGLCYLQWWEGHLQRQDFVSTTRRIFWRRSSWESFFDFSEMKSHGKKPCGVRLATDNREAYWRAEKDVMIHYEDVSL